MKKLLLSAVVLSLLAACSTTPKETAAPIENKGDMTSAGSSSASSGVNTAPISSSSISSQSLQAHEDPANKLHTERSVYFDYDKFVVSEQYRPVVENHARYLSSHRKLKIKIEGNTDERGSREYNIALGQKRADAVKTMMNALGVGDAQIETISFGEEKPMASGHDEADYAKNRRADIVYEGEK